MRLLTAVLVSTTLALGCSSGNGGGNATSSTGGSAAGGAAGAAAGGSAAGGAAAGGAGGAATSGSGGTAAGGATGDAGTGDTYSNFAQGFFTKYCVACHGAGSTTRDYTTMTDIKRDSAEIACGVATTKLAGCASFPPPEQFPIGTGAKPTNPERDRLVAWIQAGLPQ